MEDINRWWLSIVVISSNPCIFLCVDGGYKQVVAPPRAEDCGVWKQYRVRCLGLVIIVRNNSYLAPLLNFNFCSSSSLSFFSPAPSCHSSLLLLLVRVSILLLLVTFISCSFLTKFYAAPPFQTSLLLLLVKLLS